MDHAFSLILTMLIQPTLDVEPGIGIIKSASHAHLVGSLMITKFVLQFLINAHLMMIKEIV